MRRRNKPTEPAKPPPAVRPQPRPPSGRPPASRFRSWKVPVIILLVLGLGYVGFRVVSSDGDREYQAAVVAVDRRDFKRAGTHLNTHLKDHPGDRRAQLLAAQAARRSGDVGRASQLIRELEASRTEPDRVALERRLLAVQAGRLDDADRLLAACQADPNAADTPLVLEALIVGHQAALILAMFREVGGQGEMDAGLLDRARRAVDLWLNRSDRPADRAQGLVWRGSLFALTRDYPKAQAEYRQALDLDPDQFEARQKLAGLLESDAPREAADHLEVLHQRDPANADVTFALARLRRALGRAAEAAALLDGLLDADPDQVPYLMERSRVAADAGDLGRAEELLRRVLARAPGHAEAHLLYGQCLELAGRPAEAKSHYDQYQEAQVRRRKAGTPDPQRGPP